MKQYQYDFIKYAIDCGALSFGEFKLKSGKISPYFFNTGAFSNGTDISLLADYYVEAIIDSEIEFSFLFGSAYKGIPLVTAIAMVLSVNHGMDYPFAFNRKEEKDHGEGGNIVGYTKIHSSERILIVDDVISSGSSIKEAMDILGTYNQFPSSAIVALDRQEKVSHGFQVISIVTITNIIEYLEINGQLDQKKLIEDYLL